jgi:hypothetical protein
MAVRFYLRRLQLTGHPEIAGELRLIAAHTGWPGRNRPDRTPCVSALADAFEPNAARSSLSA